MGNSFILKGDIIYNDTIESFCTMKNGYLICENGQCVGVFKRIPKKYQTFKILSYPHHLIFPGLVDLHIHAPQFAFRGTGMDLELIPWLNNYAFKEEAKYSDIHYAKKAYSLFSKQLQKSATTRAAIFATKHRKSTEILMQLMENTGLISYVGKINMDRESIKELQEPSFLDSAFNTFGWLNDIQGKYKRTMPILTPRFIPSCSDELMNELKEIKEAYHIPIQSHLSENKGEIEWVKALRPDSAFYGDAYDKYDLFGKESKTIMAHCVYSCDQEIDLLKKNGVFVAHCPSSNMNLSSGIAPIRRYLEEGLKVGLGSDVAGGESESLFRVMMQTIQVSKLYWRLVDQEKKPLTFKEAFYLATMGGGEFFGKVGTFKKGYEFDAIVLDDSVYPMSYKMSIEERLERAVYLSLDMIGIKDKYVKGKKIKLK